jgi:hypothetical protein
VLQFRARQGHKYHAMGRPVGRSLLLIVLLLPASHALIPAPLANASFKVRSNGLDVLHDALDSCPRLVAVAVH